MFKAQSQRMHEAVFGGAVMPVQLPEPSFPRTIPLPEPNDAANFGPTVGQPNVPTAEAPKDIKGYLARVLSRIIQLEGLDGVKDAAKRLADLRGHVSAALLMADIEQQMQDEWTAHMEDLYEELMKEGRKAEAKVAKLWEQASAAYAAFLNLAEAEEETLRALREKEKQPAGKWDGKAEAKKHDAEVAALRVAHKNAHERSAAAATRSNQLQEEMSAAKAALREIEVRADEVAHAHDGDAHFDARTGLASQTGLTPAGLMPNGPNVR